VRAQVRARARARAPYSYGLRTGLPAHAALTPHLVPARTHTLRVHPPSAHVHMQMSYGMFCRGHVPKVTISPVRFLIWQQIYAAPDVTTRSHTLHCTVGQFEICATPSRIATHFLDYCHAPCYDDEKAFIKYTDGTRRPPPCRHRNGNALRGDCKTHSRLGIRFTPQLVGALNASRRTNQQRRFTPYPQYVAEAMHHRFCLVAAGDFPGTPKLADFAIFGAAGGCIPLVVIKSEASEQRNPTLPWRRWIDWCDISYLTTEKVVHAVNARLHAPCRPSNGEGLEMAVTPSILHSLTRCLVRLAANSSRAAGELHARARATEGRRRVRDRSEARRPRPRAQRLLLAGHRPSSWRWHPSVDSSGLCSR
jgi:hypothetical protein